MEKKRSKMIIAIGCFIITIFLFPFFIFVRLFVADFISAINAAPNIRIRMFPVLAYYGIWTLFGISNIIIGIGIAFQKRWARRLFLVTLVIISFPFLILSLSSVKTIIGWQRYTNSMTGMLVILGFFAVGLIIFLLFYYFTRPKVREQFK